MMTGAILLLAAAFERIALVDSLDFANIYDTETVKGSIEILENVMRPHTTCVLWRDKGASIMRYPSPEEGDYPSCEFPIDKRRVTPQIGVYWALRLDNCETNIIPVVFDECSKRKLDFGIHTGIEENHFCNAFMSTWTLARPQFWTRSKDGIPCAISASLAYPEVMEHKLKLIDERLEFKPQMIYLDLWRCGHWAPRYEFVPINREKWKKKYACDLPDDPADDRWLQLVSEYTTAYIREFSKRCRAAGCKFVVGFPDMNIVGPRERDSVWKRFALDWRQLAAEGVFDGVCPMNVKMTSSDMFEDTEATWRWVYENRGKAQIYYPFNAYNYRKEGYDTYAEKMDVPVIDAARRLYRMAKKCGGVGVILECVDFHCYKPEICDMIKEEEGL